MLNLPITYRPGTLDDSYAVFLVIEEAIADLLPRIGVMEETSFASPEKLVRMWDFRRSLLEHLARTAENFWVAEQDGQVIGFARAVCHDGMRELTEFFVKPGVQSVGVGRHLFEQVFPREGARRRTIIATTDLRAQARYLKAGVYPRFPIMYFEKEPEPVTILADLGFQRMTPADFAILDAIDEQILEFHRRADHVWLNADRQGWLYMRDGAPVGYGYTGKNNGPFALLVPADFPAALAKMEDQTARAGGVLVGVCGRVPNRDAVDYLLTHGYKIPDGFMAFFMSDEPFGKFEQYIVTSPPFFM